MMTRDTYSRRIDRIVQHLLGDEPVSAAKEFRSLARVSNVAPASIKTTVKGQLFQQVGPRVDKIWCGFRLAREAVLV